MAGPPYHANPLEVASAWTLPQILYMWAVGQDERAQAAKKEFILMTAAIAATLSKKGKQISKKVMASLDGPQLTAEDLYDSLDETEQLVLFGKRDGKETNSD